MTDELFLSAVKKLSDENLSLTELIGQCEALKKAGRSEQILQLYTLWARSNPDNPLLHVAQFNKSVVQTELGDLAGSRAELEAAIARNPDFFPAYINLGGIIERQGDVPGAINIWTAMVNRLPQITGKALDFKLSALKQIGRVLENNLLATNAEHVLKQSLEILADQPDVVQHYVALRLAQCEWPIMAPIEGIDRKRLLKGMGPLSMAIYTDDPMLQFASAWNYNRNVIKYPESDLREKHRAPVKGTKRRIGYVSSDLRNHAVGFIMAELFETHDREKYEIFAYYCGVPFKDPLQERIQANVDHWLDLRDMTDEQAAQRIVDDGIDILIDVNGYTKDARTRLFSLRPAPVIVNWLGFPGTMASPYHHYIIADDWIIPKENELYYSEKVLRLPCYQPNDRKRKASDHRPSRSEVGLPEDAFVFCSFNGAQKISRFVFDRWMAILARVPGSVLWLLSSNTQEANDRLAEHAMARGIAKERIVFADKRNNPDHLARYPLADLFLDTASYGAHVTASDALWMGVPILTVSGRGFASRVCGSLSRAAGLSEMVCVTPEDYVERAVALSNDKSEVARLKQKLADNRDSCLLFDTETLTRALEKLYDSMWQDHLNGALPVPDLTNLERYHEAGSLLDHDAIEMLTAPDYEGLYRQQFARWHRYHPLPADSRLWTESDIASLGLDEKIVAMPPRKRFGKS